MRAIAICSAVLAALLCAAAAPEARAAEVKVLSAGAVEPGLEVAAMLFRRRTGDKVTITYATGPQLLERVSGGETADILIAPAAVMKTLQGQGKVGTAEPALLGRVGVGVAVREGAHKPDISTVEGLRSAILSAKTVVYNFGSTGLHMEGVLKRMGLADQIAPRSVRAPNGEGVVARLREGSGAEIGFAATTEISLARDKGVVLVGPIPAEIQNFTAYVATPFAAAAGRPEVVGFFGLLTGREGKAMMGANGIQ